MNDISIWAASQDWVSIVLNALLIVLPLIVVIVAPLWASFKGAALVRAAWKELKPFVDEPGDTFWQDVRA